MLCGEPYRFSISLDTAVAACQLSVCGTFQRPFPLTQRNRPWCSSRCPSHQDSAAHDRFAPAKLVGEFGLQTSKDRVGIGRAAFGGHRNFY